MNYLKSEHLKFKRTISNKLLFIIPLITVIFAWIVGGFIGLQYTAFYWWYAFLLPGAIAILCSLSHRKEENAGKFLPIVFNTILGIFLPTALGNTGVWWLIPYCYAAKLAEPLMGIELNGTFAGKSGFSIIVLISITLSLFLFAALSYADAKDFSKRR